MTLGPISPFFVVTDLARSLAFYSETLHFEVRYTTPDEDPFFAIVGRDHAQIQLKDPRQTDDEIVEPRPNSTVHPQAPWDAFVPTQDPDELARELGVEVHAREDGLRGFEMRDPDGYVLFFGRPA